MIYLILLAIAAHDAATHLQAKLACDTPQVMTMQLREECRLEVWR